METSQQQQFQAVYSGTAQIPLEDSLVVVIPRQEQEVGQVCLETIIKILIMLIHYSSSNRNQEEVPFSSSNPSQLQDHYLQDKLII